MWFHNLNCLRNQLLQYKYVFVFRQHVLGCQYQTTDMKFALNATQINHHGLRPFLHNLLLAFSFIFSNTLSTDNHLLK